MNQENKHGQLIFLPGKGIFDLEKKEFHLENCSREEAIMEFERISKENTITKEAHVEIPKLKFQNLENGSTRTSLNKREIAWKEVEKYFLETDHTFERKTTFNSDLDDLCPIYIMKNKEGRVISEGKGFEEFQAKCSALSEAVERSFSNSNENLTINCEENLYKEKDWKLSLELGDRDIFSDKIITEWTNSYNLTRKENCHMPAELSYFNHNPKDTNLRLFAMHHSTGLSVGSSNEDAILNGIFEVLERDAYWNVMRTRMNCPDINIEELDLDNRIHKIIKELKKINLKVILKDFSLDWKIPIVHAMIVDEKGNMPAFVHGSGAALSWEVAASRAICEAVQMYSGLKDVVKVKWPEIVSVKGVMGEGKLAWCDPLFKLHVQHLIEKSNGIWNRDITIKSVEGLFENIKNMGHEIIVTKLNSFKGLYIYRVFITKTTQPDERLERIGERLQKFVKEEGLEKGPYWDPILT